MVMDNIAYDTITVKGLMERFSQAAEDWVENDKPVPDNLIDTLHTWMGCTVIKKSSLFKHYRHRRACFEKCARCLMGLHCKGTIDDCGKTKKVRAASEELIQSTLLKAAFGIENVEVVEENKKEG